MAVGEVNAEITVRATRQLLFEEDLEETKAKAEMKTQAEFVAISDAATARFSPAPGSKVGTSDGWGTQRWGTFFFFFSSSSSSSSSTSSSSSFFFFLFFSFLFFLFLFFFSFFFSFFLFSFDDTA